MVSWVFVFIQIFQNVYIKYMQFVYLNYTSVNLKEKHWLSISLNCQENCSLVTQKLYYIVSWLVVNQAEVSAVRRGL